MMFDAYVPLQQQQENSRNFHHIDFWPPKKWGDVPNPPMMDTVTQKKTWTVLKILGLPEWLQSHCYQALSGNHLFLCQTCFF